MSIKSSINPKSSRNPLYFKRVLRYIAIPIPLLLMNRLLKNLIYSIAKTHPEIFSRIEGHHQKNFIINPTNLPFLICLYPDPKNLKLVACRRKNTPQYSAKISGSLLTLLGMIDGRYDGDALFFTRDLKIEGDTEAIVCLRNALDDVDGSIAENIAAYFGSPGLKMLEFVRKIKVYV